MNLVLDKINVIHPKIEIKGFIFKSICHHIETAHFTYEDDYNSYTIDYLIRINL
jgi:hypothetical protein